MSKSRRKNLQLIASPAGEQNSVSPGKVTHDSRGNAVWDWDIATGVLARKSVEELITSLDAPGALSLDGESSDAKVNDWAGDPYNRTYR
jgi:hypothetical protein